MSEALRLADLLEPCCLTIGDAQQAVAAAELRRLHAENEALREANEAFGKRQEWWNEKMVALEERNAELVEALQGMVDCCPETRGTHNPQLAAARAALAKVEASK